MGKAPRGPNPPRGPVPPEFSGAALMPDVGTDPRTLDGHIGGRDDPFGIGTAPITAEDLLLLTDPAADVILTTARGRLHDQPRLLLTLVGTSYQTHDPLRVHVLTDGDGGAAIISQCMALLARVGPAVHAAQHAAVEAALLAWDTVHADDPPVGPVLTDAGQGLHFEDLTVSAIPHPDDAGEPPLVMLEIGGRVNRSRDRTSVMVACDPEAVTGLLTCLMRVAPHLPGMMADLTGRVGQLRAAGAYPGPPVFGGD